MTYENRLFFLNRLLVELVSSLLLSLVLFILSLMFFLLKRRLLGSICQIAGLAILIVLGYGVVTKEYLAQLEGQYKSFDLDATALDVRGNIKYIVILGSGHVSDSRLPINSQIGSSSLYRLVEGIRIQKAIPTAKLLISWGIGYDPIPNADVVAQVAVLLGDEDKIHLF